MVNANGWKLNEKNWFAKNVHEHFSGWSDALSVSMPKSKPYSDRPFLGFLQSIFERFPLLTKLR
jgi:hypothetical protein